MRDGHRWLRTYLWHDPARARAPRRALHACHHPITVQIGGWQPYFDAALLKMPTITSSTFTTEMHAHHEAHFSDRLPCVRIALGPRVSSSCSPPSPIAEYAPYHQSGPAPPPPQIQPRRFRRPHRRHSPPPRLPTPMPTPQPATPRRAAPAPPARHTWHGRSRPRDRLEPRQAPPPPPCATRVPAPMTDEAVMAFYPLGFCRS